MRPAPIRSRTGATGWVGSSPARAVSGERPGGIRPRKFEGRRPLPPPPAAAAGPERLQKILSRAGVSSRRQAEELIREGLVAVNGKLVSDLGSKATPGQDRITLRGRPIQLTEQLEYLLLNKPVGVVTTLFDPEGRPTILDVLPRQRHRLFPVGRLDFHTSGLLLLTNDGELAQRLTHPRYGIEKVYRVKVKGEPTERTLEQLARGVRLEEGVTAPARVRVVRSSEGKTWLEMVLTEGRRREVRRMCEYVGHPVEKLSRIALGPLKLGRLAVGESRPLTEREIFSLRHSVGLGAAA